VKATAPGPRSRPASINVPSNVSINPSSFRVLS
jgi:hypothetical protein